MPVRLLRVLQKINVIHITWEHTTYIKFEVTMKSCRYKSSNLNLVASAVNPMRTHGDVSQQMIAAHWLTTLHLVVTAASRAHAL
jgi:hypothetical protein